MRILWLGHNLAYPPKGGPLQRNYNLLKEAAKHHEVHALLFDQPASRPPNVKQLLNPQEFDHCSEKNFKSIPVPSGGEASGNDPAEA